MARVEFERYDLPVTIGRDHAGKVTLRVGAREPFAVTTLNASSPDDVAIDIRDTVRLFQHPPPTAFAWTRPRNAARIGSVFRLTIELSDPGLASMDWEAILKAASYLIGYSDGPSPAAPEWTVVRSSHVRPRFETLPLTLPIRLLHVNPWPEHPVGEWVRLMFGTKPNTEVERAVVTAFTDQWGAPEEWPTVDVVHVDSLPTLADADALLSTGRPDRHGTLGWFARWTERWQTRLVVLHCDSPTQARVGRRFAQALIDKGGPAVLVVYARGTGGASRVIAFYQGFYSLLIHDNALDQAVAFAGRDVDPALFAGAGREEGLRASNVGMSLVDLWSRLSPDTTEWDSTAATQIHNLVRHHPNPDAVVNSLKDDLSDTRRKWIDLKFDQHEGDGLLPLAAELHQLRSRIHPPAPSLRGRSRAESATAEPPAAVPRFVNGSLWSEVDGRLEQVPQDRALLRMGELYHLGLNVGPRDERIVTLNAAALFEEVFKWTESDGVWVEFAVTGIDFDVIGDPIREVWLPRHDVTEPVYFAVRPKKFGVAHLRYGLYYQHNLIQSFHLAALISYPGDLVRPAETLGTDALRRALDVSAETVGDARYMARLEYSRTSALERIPEMPPRALSISANLVDDGRAVLTIKGADHFTERVGVDVDNETRDIVTQIRKALNEISYATPQGGSQPQYQFGPYTPAGDLDDRFDKAVVKLALAGFRLFNNLEPDAKKQRTLTDLLAGERKIIQVAQLLRKKVVPWAFIYDRAFDDQPTIIGGQVAAHGVCRAPLLVALTTGAAGTGPSPSPVALAATECGKHDDCLLNPKRQAERLQNGLALYDERSVACPLRFWGFRHVIEVPPQQVEDAGSTGHEETTRIPAAAGVNLVAGLNEMLGNCETHWKGLCSLSTWGNPEYERAQLLARLRSEDIDFIYFYCHARGGEEDPAGTNPPYLEFQKKGESAGMIRPQDFADAVQWKHGPLIFLNACGTLGYSPDALSPFLKTLVDGRRAAGVLGTEVPVAEILAGDVARLFIERFVRGAHAGDALLDVRRELLKNKNPLGLVYTLFAPAELAIV